ncbi:hypothetical protein DEDE109153_07310 [Deinococcus deserti]
MATWPVVARGFVPHPLGAWTARVAQMVRYSHATGPLHRTQAESLVTFRHSYHSRVPHMRRTVRFPHPHVRLNKPGQRKLGHGLLRLWR